MSRTKTIIIVVAFVLLIGGLAGCIVALCNLTSNKPDTTEIGAKIILNDGSYSDMKKNTESLPDKNLVFEYYLTGITLHKADQIGFKVDGQSLSVYTDAASTGVDLTDKDKALYKVLILVTGKYDIYLKNYKSGVWTVYMTTDQVMPTAVDEQGVAIADGQAMPQRMTFLRSRTAEHAASVNVSAIVTPENAKVKGSEWSVAWTNAQSDWAQDKDISEYFALSSDGLNATLECLQPFGEQITLGVKVTDLLNNSKTATTTVDYMKRNSFNSLSYKTETETPTGEVSATAYYVTGSFSEWEVNIQNEMQQFDDAANSWAQYKATVTLAKNDEIKVVKGDGSKYFDGWELWSSTADYAHVNKESEGYGNLVIDKAGKYDVTFKSDKENEQSHQISIVPHTADEQSFDFGQSYTLHSENGQVSILLTNLAISQSVGTTGSVPETWTVKVGFTSEFVTAFAVNSSELTAEQLAESVMSFTLSEFNISETELTLFALPTEFVSKYINGEYDFDGDVMYIEFTPIGGTVNGANKIYFSFDFAQGIIGVEIGAPVVF